MELDTSWSRLFDTEMGNYVATLMSNPSLHYHNINHIARLYHRAEQWGLEYDPDLDCAILWHDSVYDAMPDKELRSAEILRETSQSMPGWFEGINIAEANKMILSTITHKMTEEVNNLLIKLDLADMTEQEQARKNFWLIMQENMDLYDIPIHIAAQGSLDFMKTFITTVGDNTLTGFWEFEFIGDGEKFWQKVLNSVTTTIIMSRTIVELHERNYGH